MIQAQHFINALKGQSDEIKPGSYSGRGMYGAKCICVDLERTGQIMELAVLLLAGGLTTPEVTDLGDQMRTDSMGFGLVVYWPSIGLTPEEVAQLQDDDEDDDD
jgi:hypothetical protein